MGVDGKLFGGEGGNDGSVGGGLKREAGGMM